MNHHSTNREFNRVFANIMSIFAILAIVLSVGGSATAQAFVFAPTIDGVFKAGDASNPSNMLLTVYLPFVVNQQRVGERLNIYYSGSQNFPANTPFHIAHGWLLDITDHPELFDFQLQVNGFYREEDFIEMKPGERRTFVFNFPDGMTGVHTFNGHWFAPCGAVYENCADPNKIIESNTSTVEVTFIP